MRGLGSPGPSIAPPWPVRDARQARLCWQIVIAWQLSILGKLSMENVWKSCEKECTIADSHKD